MFTYETFFTKLDAIFMPPLLHTALMHCTWFAV